MALLQTFKCDIPNCPVMHTEATDGDGAPGWGQLKGVALNGTPNPVICPRHLNILAEFIDTAMPEIKK